MAERLAIFDRQHGALELDRAALVGLLEREIQQLEAPQKAKRAAHEAACKYCRKGTGDFCGMEFTSSRSSDEIKELRLLIGLELADAERARARPAKLREHKDGFCAYWQNLRARRMALSDGMCERGCGKPATDCHHLYYDVRLRGVGRCADAVQGMP
jgi:hypothetical protein